MSNVLLAGFGTLVTMLALAGFSVWQLDRTEAPVHDLDAAVPEPREEVGPDMEV